MKKIFKDETKTFLSISHVVNILLCDFVRNYFSLPSRTKYVVGRRKLHVNKGR